MNKENTHIKNYVFGNIDKKEYLSKRTNTFESPKDEATFFLEYAVFLRCEDTDEYHDHILRCESVAKDLDNEIFNSYREYNEEL